MMMNMMMMIIRGPVCRTLRSWIQKQEPHAEHHFANFCWGTADLEVNLLALEEGTDGLYCCPGYPSVCGAVAKSSWIFPVVKLFCSYSLLNKSQRRTLWTLSLTHWVTHFLTIFASFDIFDNFDNFLKIFDNFLSFWICFTMTMIILETCSL